MRSPRRSSGRHRTGVTTAIREKTGDRPAPTCPASRQPRSRGWHARRTDCRSPFLATAEPGRLLHAMDTTTSGDQLNTQTAYVYRICIPQSSDLLIRRSGFVSGDGSPSERAECAREPVRPVTASPPVLGPLGTLATLRIPSRDRSGRQSGPCVGFGEEVGLHGDHFWGLRWHGAGVEPGVRRCCRRAVTRA